jgi:hypothetical protein
MQSFANFRALVAQQLDKVNISLLTLSKAGKGAFLKLSETGTKRFNECVLLGEAQDKPFIAIDELKANFSNKELILDDLKGSVSQIRLAAVGLLFKTIDQTGEVFEDLVEAGEGKVKAKTKKPRSVAKKPNKAAA